MLRVFELLGGALAATVLMCSAPASFVQAQGIALQLPIDQAQAWCFQTGYPGCEGEWQQLEPDRVQFSSDRCDTVFILPAVARQSGQGNVTPAIVIVESAPHELDAPAHRSGNLRVLTDICTIMLEAR